jgi:hypothetical protein
VFSLYKLVLKCVLTKCSMYVSVNSQLFYQFFDRIDDIQDNSILRRGIPVAHSIYGVASTINAANYVMIIALEKSLELGHHLVTHLFNLQHSFNFFLIKFDVIFTTVLAFPRDSMSFTVHCHLVYHCRSWLHSRQGVWVRAAICHVIQSSTVLVRLNLGRMRNFDI